MPSAPPERKAGTATSTSIFVRARVNVKMTHIMKMIVRVRSTKREAGSMRPMLKVPSKVPTANEAKISSVSLIVKKNRSGNCSSLTSVVNSSARRIAKG